MGGGTVGCCGGRVPPASGRFADRFAMVAARHLVANIGRACRPAGLSAIEKNRRSRGEKGISKGSPGERASAGADPAVTPHQHSGGARFGGRPFENKVVNRLLRTTRVADGAKFLMPAGSHSRTVGSGAWPKIFAVLTGAWLGLSLLKFGNPVILERLVEPPKAFWEFVFSPWPVAWGYGILAVLMVVAAGVIRFKIAARRWRVVALLAWF